MDATLPSAVFFPIKSCKIIVLMDDELFSATIGRN
jgi:hypothetical protein